MIAWLSGKVVDTQLPGKLVIDVNGVGYDVETSLPTYFEFQNREDNIGIHIHTVVREDALLLYGFKSLQERALFRALIKVNGVGPKSAIAILSSITPDEFVSCINQQNTTLLTKLPGIGKKTSERLVVEMKDTLQNWMSAVSTVNPMIPLKATEQDEAICALEALGYKFQEAARVVKKLDDGQKGCQELIRHALQVLSNR
jgi:Holliday junction DNA helicase RuvA